MVVKNTKNYTKHFKSSGICMIGIIGQYCTTSLEKQRWKILYQKNTKNVYVTFQKQRNMYEWSYWSKICLKCTTSLEKQRRENSLYFQTHASTMVSTSTRSSNISLYLTMFQKIIFRVQLQYPHRHHPQSTYLTSFTSNEPFLFRPCRGRASPACWRISAT